MIWTPILPIFTNNRFDRHFKKRGNILLVLVAYDVNTETPAGRKRLRRVAKLCVNHGQRVQFSVFEILVDNAMWVTLKAELLKEIDLEKDSLRCYNLGNNWSTRVEHFGAKASYNPEGPRII